MSEPNKRAKMAATSSPAWDLLAPYMVKGCCEETVKSYLLEARVSTLAELLEFMHNPAKGARNMLELASKGVSMNPQQYDAILKSLREKVDVVSRLAGKILGVKDIALPDNRVNSGLDLDTENLKSERPNDTLPAILVLGSSGSGKTIFAAQVLPDILKRNDKKGFTVYMLGDVVRGNLNSPVTTVEDVARLAKERILRLVETEIGIKITSFPLKMTVIIDEIGLHVDKQFVGTGAQLRDITQALERLLLGGPEGTVQLVLAGTGLDRITSSVCSNQEAVKIRMQPWSVEEVMWLLRSTTSGKKEEIAQMIKHTPIFCQLGTNARAAWFLVEALIEYDDYFERTALIDSVVTRVAFKYIRANGMKDLNAKQRSKVAKIVLQAVQDAKKGDASATLSEDKDLCVASACNSLLDTHVEGGKLMDGQFFAVSVTPAITIVLTALMGNISNLSSSWSGFENIVALAELQHLLVVSEEEDGPLLSIRRSSLPFPAPKAKKNIKVPKLDLHSILVNGAGAPYADIISHFRLIQCKHTTDDTERGLVKLNLKSELAKMGVLKAELYKGNEYLPQRFLTKQLMKQWKRLGSGEGGGSGEARNVESHASEQKKKSPKNGDARYNLIPDGGTRSTYPMGQLDVPDQREATVFEDLSLPSDGSWMDEASEDVITIIFATNKGGFILEGILPKGVTLDVRRQHLNCEGQLVEAQIGEGQIGEGQIGEEMTSEIAECLELLVDVKKVHIRFKVCSF
jgi:hypothetical protein